ncbi:MAG: hypothetical protein K2Y71_15540 [Xanthobacteraceae bacterium]|nr:hypothetical protein [Xanthobacteraceae bacterium]
MILISVRRRLVRHSNSGSNPTPSAELDALVLTLVDVIETATLDKQKRLYDALVAAKEADPIRIAQGCDGAHDCGRDRERVAPVLCRTR